MRISEIFHCIKTSLCIHDWKLLERAFQKVRNDDIDIKYRVYHMVFECRRCGKIKVKERDEIVWPRE